MEEYTVLLEQRSQLLKRRYLRAARDLDLTIQQSRMQREAVINALRIHQAERHT